VRVVIGYLTLVLTFLLPQSAPSTAAQSQTNAALSVLRASNPKVQWDAKSAITADITGDGISDVVVVGYDADSVWLALVPGTKAGKLAKPILQQLLLGAGAQSSICQKPVHIEIYPLDCEGSAGPLPGCKAVKGASSFALDDDACDPFNFYWDSERKALRWWRN
jgi:hypothetical protein